MRMQFESEESLGWSVSQPTDNGLYLNLLKPASKI